MAVAPSGEYQSSLYLSFTRGEGKRIASSDTHCHGIHKGRGQENSMIRHALSWNSQGERTRGRPRNTMRRDMESEVKKMGHAWK